MADKTKKDEQALQDIFEDKRTFIHDGEKYFIDNAGIDEVRQADWFYSKTYNEALLAGVTTMAQMQDILEERDIIGKKYEEKRVALIKELDEGIAELNSAKTLDEKKVCAEKVEDVRNRLFRWNQRASSPMSNSVEQLAEDARIEYLTSAMVKDSNGDKVWESYDEYKTTSNPTLAMRSRYSVMLALQGLAENFLETTPEALARKEIEEAESTKEIEEAKPKAKVEEKEVKNSKKK
jgi:hypothetical protein